MLTVTPCFLNRVLSHSSEPLNKTGRRTRAALLTHTRHLIDTVRLCRVTDRGKEVMEFTVPVGLLNLWQKWVECGPLVNIHRVPKSPFATPGKILHVFFQANSIFKVFLN